MSSQQNSPGLSCHLILLKISALTSKNTHSAEKFAFRAKTSITHFLWRRRDTSYMYIIIQTAATGTKRGAMRETRWDFTQKRNYRLVSDAAAAGVYTFRYRNLIKVPRERERKMKRERHIQKGIRTRGAGDVHRLEVARLDHCHSEAAGGGQVAQGQHQLA